MKTKTQHVRCYINYDSGEVLHLHTQDTPIPINRQPIDIPKDAGNIIIRDFVIELDNDVEHAYANVLIEELEIYEGDLRLKLDKPKEERRFTLRSVIKDPTVEPVLGSKRLTYSGGLPRPHTPKE